MTVLAVCLAGIIGYLLGRLRGFVLAVRYIESLVPGIHDPFIDSQREQAPWQ